MIIYMVYTYAGKEFMSLPHMVPPGAVVRGHINLRVWEAEQIATAQIEHMKIVGADGQRLVAARWEEDMAQNEDGWREATKWLLDAVIDDRTEAGATQIHLTPEYDAPEVWRQIRLERAVLGFDEE